MNQLLFFSHIFISLLTFNFIHGQSEETALLFNINNNDVMNSANSNNSDIFVNCATACPFRSTSVPEYDFNEKHSVSKNALFLQEMYLHSHCIEKIIKLGICQKSFELSVIYNKIDNVVEFGYEIYYEDSPDNNKELKESVYSKYRPVEVLPTGILQRSLSKVKQNLDKTLSFPNDKPNLPLEGKQMRFLWISTFKLSYDGIHRHPNRVTYETSVNVSDSPNKCQDYELGKEIYKDINMENIYHQENLDNIFKGKIGPKIYKRSDIDDLAKELVLEEDHVSITMWSLVPDSYFHNYSPKSLSCSYLTTVPVWSYLADTLLKQLDQYIDVITRVLPGGKLYITSGTYEILRLYLKMNEPSVKAGILEPSKRYVEMYLQSNNKVPFPAKIYKMIEYELPTCTEDQKTCWYSILIEIHNEPLVSGGLCGENRDSKCYLWGWNSIYETKTENENETDPGKYISCCEVTRKNEKKLKLKKDKTKSKSVFNLRKNYEYFEDPEKRTKTLQEIINEEINEKRKSKIDNAPNKKVAETGGETEASSSHQLNQKEAISTDIQP